MTETASLASADLRALQVADFRNRHRGGRVVVCGCGESLKLLEQPERFVTIGVNDVGRLFTPDYLVVVNPRSQFSAERFAHVERSNASVLFTQLADLGVPHPNVIRFRLGRYGGTDLSDPNVLHYTQNSPYVALCLAAHMGASRIGLIGVDFTANHFFAPTGIHPLATQLSIIDEQYRRLGEALRARGIEVLNLSPASRLTAFPKACLSEFRSSEQTYTPQAPATLKAITELHFTHKRMFFVNYKFLSCGEVFTDGLRHAAQSLGITFQEAYWDDPQLPAMVQAFKPDWLFAVHGRRFEQRWRNGFPSVKKAVWLLDEPYEVDDTAKWSSVFDAVFLNDPSTLDRHLSAYYLPVAYDPEVHRDTEEARKYPVGFIGGYNETRERYLVALQEARLLSYVVGGPWKAPQLRQLCLAPNISARATADLYRQTKLIINVFRAVHHFNQRQVQPYSMNPRIYEALACGAIVVSEARPELSLVFPEIPLFSDATQLVETVRDLLTNEERYHTLKQVCRERIRAHTYRQRLWRVVETLDSRKTQGPVRECPRKETFMKTAKVYQQRSSLPLGGWVEHGQVTTVAEDGAIALGKVGDDGPGTEQGLASAETYENIELTFEVNLAQDTCFIAKVHQTGQFDQTTNSYHLFCHPKHTYLARHHHIFRPIQVKREHWQRISLRRYGQTLELEIDGVQIAKLYDRTLRSGYCFIGIKGGMAWLRNIGLRRLNRLNDGEDLEMLNPEVPGNALPKYTVRYNSTERNLPAVSIITTVYDRVQCLADCIRSVKQLQYRDFEHIVVSDHPPSQVVDRISTLLRSDAIGDVTYADLQERFNNWGIAPASVGLYLARGQYVCFLSDDNGYTADHLTPLVAALDQDPNIGFAYSSCQYAGRLVLRHTTPRPGGIDLGQPLFRKELFDRYLSGVLPFDMLAWDWHMIETFMRHGVKWRHIDRATFLFRLAACRERARV